MLSPGTGPNKENPPNDWESFFGGSAWEPSGTNDGQYYLHLFDKKQPDWNWDNPEVHKDFLKTLRFWGDRGVSVFRVDVASGCAKDMSEPYMRWDEIQKLQKEILLEGNKKLHPFMDRRETLEIYQEWRTVFDEYDPPLM